MKEIYQNTSCSIDPPSEMEERGVESPLLREESTLNSISGGFGRQLDQFWRVEAPSVLFPFPEGSLAPKGSSCAPAKRPCPVKCQAWHWRAQGLQGEGYKIEADLGQGLIYACSPNCVWTVHSPSGEMSGIPSGDLSRLISTSWDPATYILQMEWKIWRSN